MLSSVLLANFALASEDQKWAFLNTIECDSTLCPHLRQAASFYELRKGQNQAELLKELFTHAVTPKSESSELVRALESAQATANDKSAAVTRLTAELAASQAATSTNAAEVTRLTGEVTRLTAQASAMPNT